MKDSESVAFEESSESEDAIWVGTLMLLMRLTTTARGVSGLGTGLARAVGLSLNYGRQVRQLNQTVYENWIMPRTCITRSIGRTVARPGLNGILVWTPVRYLDRSVAEGDVAAGALRDVRFGEDSSRFIS